MEPTWKVIRCLVFFVLVNIGSTKGFRHRKLHSAEISTDSSSTDMLASDEINYSAKTLKLMSKNPCSNSNLVLCFEWFVREMNKTENLLKEANRTLNENIHEEKFTPAPHSDETTGSNLRMTKPLESSSLETESPQAKHPSSGMRKEEETFLLKKRDKRSNIQEILDLKDMVVQTESSRSIEPVSIKDLDVDTTEATLPSSPPTTTTTPFPTSGRTTRPATRVPVTLKLVTRKLVTDGPLTEKPSFPINFLQTFMMPVEKSTLKPPSFTKSSRTRRSTESEEDTFKAQKTRINLVSQLFRNHSPKTTVSQTPSPRPKKSSNFYAHRGREYRKWLINKRKEAILARKILRAQMTNQIVRKKVQIYLELLKKSLKRLRSLKQEYVDTYHRSPKTTVSQTPSPRPKKSSNFYAHRGREYHKWLINRRKEAILARKILRAQMTNQIVRKKVQIYLELLKKSLKRLISLKQEYVDTYHHTPKKLRKGRKTLSRRRFKRQAVAFPKTQEELQQLLRKQQELIANLQRKKIHDQLAASAVQSENKTLVTDQQNVTTSLPNSSKSNQNLSQPSNLTSNASTPNPGSISNGTTVKGTTMSVLQINLQSGNATGTTATSATTTSTMNDTFSGAPSTANMSKVSPGSGVSTTSMNSTSPGSGASRNSTLPGSAVIRNSTLPGVATTIGPSQNESVNGVSSFFKKILTSRKSQFNASKSSFPTNGTSSSTTDKVGGNGTSNLTKVEREVQELESAPKGMILKVMKQGQSNLRVGAMVDGNLNPLKKSFNGRSLISRGAQRSNKSTIIPGLINKSSSQSSGVSTGATSSVPIHVTSIPNLTSSATNNQTGTFNGTTLPILQIHEETAKNPKPGPKVNPNAGPKVNPTAGPKVNSKVNNNPIKSERVLQSHLNVDVTGQNPPPNNRNNVNVPAPQPQVQPQPQAQPQSQVQPQLASPHSPQGQTGPQVQQNSPGAFPPPSAAKPNVLPIQNHPTQQQARPVPAQPAAVAQPAQLAATPNNQPLPSAQRVRLADFLNSRNNLNQPQRNAITADRVMWPHQPQKSVFNAEGNQIHFDFERNHPGPHYQLPEVHDNQG